MNRWKRRFLSLFILSLVYALALWLLQETAGQKCRSKIANRKDYAEIQTFLKEHDVKSYEVSMIAKKSFGFPSWLLTEFLVLGFVLGSYFVVDTLVGTVLQRREKKAQPKVGTYRR